MLQSHSCGIGFRKGYVLSVFRISAPAPAPVPAPNEEGSVVEKLTVSIVFGSLPADGTLVAINRYDTAVAHKQANS